MWQVDWALQHHAQYCYQKIMDESWKPLTPLPEPLDQADLAAPPAPTMLLLTINKRVLARWHDHADLGAAFREKYAECKASHPLDLPNAKRETTRMATKAQHRKSCAGALPSVVTRS